MSARQRGGRRSARGTLAPQPRRFRGLLPWPAARTRRRWWRGLRRAPPLLQIMAGLTAAALVALAVNGVYQLVRKPTELFFPVSGALYKTPGETWAEYAPLFRRYSTAAITPETLAALAQVEGSGNPLVRTYWRWAWAGKPFDVYRPASSAVGMYQITDGTFAEARHYCIHHHVLVREGPWNDWRSCWFNNLYLRILPGDAVELTAAYLDLEVTRILARHRIAAATSAGMRHLAAAVHLCGAGVGDAYARRGLHFSAGERCGDHDPRAYLARVDALHAVFVRLAAAREGMPGAR
ncbi:MAG: lytic transglycosylase domain-containing protein [Steroidobacteraceae bacterium]